MLPVKLKTAKRGRRLVLVVLALAALGLSRAEAGSLRAGAAARNITTDTPTQIIHDPLYAKALVVDDGSTKAVIVSTDLGQASQALVASVRRRVREGLGIDEDNVLVNASHNHYAGGQTAKDLVERIVEAISEAAATMVPVRIGVGTGHEDRITMNRRLRLKNGKHWTIRRANPSPQDSEVAGLGPLDPEIGILRVDTMAGEPLAVVYNFAGHAYGGVPNGGVTADFPGFASSVIEEAMDGAVALFLQGAAGDVTPIRYKDFDAPPPTERLGTMLGLSTLAAVKRLPMQEEGEIRVVRQVVELPRRTDIQDRIESLEAQQEEILQFFTGIGCGTHGAGTSLNFKGFLPLYMKYAVDPDYPSYSSYLYAQEEMTGRGDLEHLDVENKKRVEKYLQCIYNMEKLIRIRSNLQILKRRLAGAAAGPLKAEIQGIRIGDFVLVTFPGEPFAEVGLRIKERSPFEHTFLAAYTNGSVGYAPTADAYDKEAYEDSLTQLAPRWQEIYEAKALEIIDKLASPRRASASGR